MTIQVMVAVFDRAVQAYGRPFATPSRGAALRSFVDEVKREGSDMGKLPKDYELYQVGTFDDVAGVFSADLPELVIRGEDAYNS